MSSEPFGGHHLQFRTIPGIDQVAAALILTEIGDDVAHMIRSGAPERLAGWPAPSPGQHESAGKRKTGRTRHGGDEPVRARAGR